MSEPSDNAREQRRRAEERLAQLPAEPPPREEELQRLVHELHVHQIELEMQNETLLAQQEELRIAAIAFESQEGMLITDTHGIILRVNRAFTRLTGYSAEEAIGRTPALLRSGRHEAEFYRQLWQLLGKTGYWQGEMWNRRKDGKIYAEWLTISAVVNPQGITSHYVGTFSEITRNKEAEAEIHRLAYYDPLTQLPNRRLLQDRLGQAMAASGRSNQHGALLFLDLDGFKNLNDTRGHEIGDQLLIEVAQRLHLHIREGDTVARQSGDEFLVILENLSPNLTDAAIQAGLVGEKILKTLADAYLLGGQRHYATASIGIGLFRNHDDSAETLLRHADLAMYEAKRAGRNCLRCFDPAMQEAIDRRSALEADLRQALEARQLLLYFQPQFNAEGEMIGAEALLRWQHPQRGLVSPNEFIPLAEETGLILPMGRWVLESACALLSHWSSDPATAQLRLAVNVSARQFRQADFVAEVGQILSQSGANPRRLKIELTESMVLDDVEAMFVTMYALKALGIGFALDDFGTGHSSLSYLSQLPLDQLKIDRSFVCQLPERSSDAIIAKTIITMARSLKLEVIAEGVETEAQRNFLCRNHCKLYQGYLFSRPLPLEEFERMAQQRWQHPLSPGDPAMTDGVDKAPDLRQVP